MEMRNAFWRELPRQHLIGDLTLPSSSSWSAPMSLHGTSGVSGTGVLGRRPTYLPEDALRGESVVNDSGWRTTLEFVHSTSPDSLPLSH
mmetsp:Transcript_7068/g.26484  ORF Transcript_7068/g.26484 Transcript_7068/m.26484 type:complete len:89 (+) Transcript_7068:3379-3645(+)